MILLFTYVDMLPPVEIVTFSTLTYSESETTLNLLLA